MRKGRTVAALREPTTKPIEGLNQTNVSGCTARSLRCSDLSATVCQRVHTGKVVGINNRCQDRLSHFRSLNGVRPWLTLPHAARRLGRSRADTLWVSRSRSTRAAIGLLQCAFGPRTHRTLGGGHVGR